MTAAGDFGGGAFPSVGLVVDGARMRANLDSTKGLIYTSAILLVLVAGVNTIAWPAAHAGELPRLTMRLAAAVLRRRGPSVFVTTRRS